MAAGPSPSGSSPPGLASTSTSFFPGTYVSSSASPPKSVFAPSQKMAGDGFGPATQPSALQHTYNISPIGERKPLEKDPSSLMPFPGLDHSVSNPDTLSMPTILIRKLPRSTGVEALQSMLLFAKDLVDADFVPLDATEDKNYLSAVARFKTLGGANEARDRLHGKPNTANDAKMIVEVLQYPAPGRRNTVGGSIDRQSSTSTSPGAPTTNGRQASRYDGTFRNMEKMSPPNGTAVGSTTVATNGDLPIPEAGSHFHSLFSPQSPLSNSLRDPPRVTGKSVINEEMGEDETGELLKDPIAYAKSGQTVQPPLTRRTTNPSLPVSRFAGLSLSTTSGPGNIASPPLSTFASPRSVGPIQSPNSAISTMSPNNSIPTSMGPLGASSYQLNNHYQRHNYPPVNPADQNPPCNTLYVGNLPIDTSEDELKAMFSKQRGYKRLCFRTKQNGPMCFVEFEDVSFATKALNELYGQPLHNSVKGGIRLSFSKNPLGVRNGQTNQMPPTPMTPQSALPGMGMGSSHGFSTATGPPPGIPAPPGLGTPVLNGGNSGFGGFGNGGAFGGGSNPTFGNNVRTQPMPGTGSTGSGFYNGLVESSHPAFMMGR